MTGDATSMRTIAIVNQKGGCAKTTTAVNLAGALAEDGARVLVVDLDPQAHATLALGVDPEAVDENLYEVLADEGGAKRLAEVVAPAGERLHVAPSGIVLSALEQKLAQERAEARVERLLRALAEVASSYEYAIVDCPPNVGLLTFNALRAAQEVIVPVEASHFAMHGVEKLLETIALLAERLGIAPDVRILATLYDGRTRFAREMLAELRERFGDACFDTVIRHSVKLREAARRGVPVARFAAASNAAADYAALAAEVAGVAPLASLSESAPAAPREIVIEFRDAGAHDVRIAGDFNGWVPDRGVVSSTHHEQGTRVWRKILQLSPGTYEYRYVVDGEWREDPANPKRVASPAGNAHSLLVVR
ncbi:MAG: chromosome partitioning protein ParA [Proteobacteria bacterium]|nr:MAG: chromosome partitioning protein ParA [Pseudomonadota bacterium]